MNTKNYLKILGIIFSVGIALALAMIATGFNSPYELTGEALNYDPDTPYYIEFIQHSGPYHLIIKLHGNWSLIVLFSSTPCGKYTEIWHGNGSYPEIVKVFFPSRGYALFITQNNGSLILQRLRPAMQYDYLNQGFTLLAIFGAGEILILALIRSNLQPKIYKR